MLFKASTSDGAAEESLNTPLPALVGDNIGYFGGDLSLKNIKTNAVLITKCSSILNKIKLIL